jgi:biotin synthase-related radical SAM superfamily protein
MKTAEYCVDYLSHQWNPTTDDLITTYKEICKQRQKYVVKEITATTSLLIKNEKKLKKSEEYKLKRHQNALWRSMSRHCTNHLGKSNKLINPATVSW